MSTIGNLVFSDADSPDWEGVTSKAKGALMSLWPSFKAAGVSAEITSGKRNKQDNSWHNLGEAVDLWLGDENGNRLGPDDPRVVSMMAKAKAQGWQEVLYHDAGSGNHLHIGNYTGAATGEGSYILDGSFDRTTDPVGARPPLMPSREPEVMTTGSNLVDRFLSGFYDNWLTGSMRTTWAGLSTQSLAGGAYANWEPSQEDVDYVTKALPGNIEAQRWALVNASNPYHLAKLVSMKVEDEMREERLESFKGSLAAVAAGKGAELVGSVIGDPLTFVPLGQEAVLVRALGRLGPVAAHLSTSKLLRYAMRYVEVGATNAALNVADRKLAEVYAGNKQNYEAAALIGGIAGAGLRMTADLWNNATKKLVGALDNMESHAIAHAVGVNLPNAVPKIREGLLRVHDAEFVRAANSSVLSKQAQAGNVAVVSRKQLEEAGVFLPDTVAAFYKADERLAVVIKDALKSDTNLDNLLAHEIGVHGSLKEVLGEEVYSSVRAAVEERIRAPHGEWLQAVKAVPSGGWEEVLGHWIERGGTDNTLMESLAKGVNQSLRNLGANPRFTDGDLRSFVKTALDNAAETARGYRTLPDGRVELGGLKYSNSNIFNPHTLDGVLDLEGIRRTGPFDVISKWTEAGWFYGTPYGTLSNSASKVAQRLAAEGLHDARMRPYNGKLVMPIELQKEHIRRRLQTYQNDYLSIRGEALGVGGRLDSTAFHDFDKQVRECFNATYSNNTAGLSRLSWPSEIVQAAGILKGLRDEIIHVGKRSAEMFGVIGKRNLIDKEWKPLDSELWRVLDHDKWATFVQKFPSAEKAEEFLTEYAKGAAKRDLVEAKLLAAKKKIHEAATAEAKAKGTDLPPAPSVTPEEVSAWIDENALKWAKGNVDRNLSQIDSVKQVLGDPHLIHERFPMDTTTLIQTPWGELFSYDVHLRSDDFDRIVPSIINRFSGEAALHNMFENAEALAKVRGQMESDLKKAVAHNVPGYNEERLIREMAAFDKTISSIRGVRDPENIKSLLNATVDTLKGLSYAQNGANMGMNQIGEVGGAIGYTGARAILHLVPAVNDVVQAMLHGRATVQEIKAAERFVFGATPEAHVWQTDLKSRIWKEASTRTGLARIMDPVNTLITASSRITSQLNFLPKLTDNMIRGARNDTMMDSLEWAAGKSFWPTRNPFSAKKLQAAGVDSAMADTIKADILKYIQRNAEGDIVSFNPQRWEAEAPTTYFKWKFLTENQALRAITQPTIGNTNMLKDSGPFMKIVFQFKDFSLRVMNSHLARMLTHRELDDSLALMWSMATNMGVYAILTNARAFAYFGDNEPKRRAYLEARLSPTELGKAAFFRSLVGTGLSFFEDIYEGATGSQSLRTTVDRTSQFTGSRQKGKPRDLSDAVGDVVTQFPVVRAAKGVAYDAPMTAYKAMFTDKLAQQDLKNLARTFPLQNFLPLAYITNMLVNDSNLPKK